MKEKNQLPEKLQQAVSQSKISDMSLAESLASPYAPFMGEVQEQIDVLKTLEKGDAEHAEKARRIALDLGKIRSRKNEQKKKDKDFYLTVGRFIDSLANTVEGMITLTQEEAKEHSLYFERLEEQRRQKLREDRWATLSEYMETEPPGLDMMTDEVFGHVLSGAKSNYLAVKEAERKAEEERIEKERQQEEFRQRQIESAPYKQFFQGELVVGMSDGDYGKFLKSAKKGKSDYDKEQEKIRVENERLRKEAEKKEKERKDLEEKAERERDLNFKKAVLSLKEIGFVETEGGLSHSVHHSFIGYLHLKDFNTSSEMVEYVNNQSLWIESQDEMKRMRDQKEEERKRKAVEDAKREAELDRIKSELEAERKRKEAEDLSKKKAEEARLKAEAEAKKAPSKTKIKNAIDSMVLPELELDKESDKVYQDISDKFSKFKSWAVSQLNK